MLIWSREHHREREKGGRNDYEDDTSTSPLSTTASLVFVAAFAISMSVLAFCPITQTNSNVPMNVLPGKFASSESHYETSLACFVEEGAAVMEKYYGKHGDLRCPQLSDTNSKCVGHIENFMSIVGAADDNAAGNAGRMISSTTTPNAQIDEDPTSASIGGAGLFYSVAQARPTILLSNVLPGSNVSSHNDNSLAAVVKENSKKPDYEAKADRTSIGETGSMVRTIDDMHGCDCSFP
jgi:hypothetical protein